MCHVLKVRILTVGSSRSHNFSTIMIHPKRTASQYIHFIWMVQHLCGINRCLGTIRSTHGTISFQPLKIHFAPSDGYQQYAHYSVVATIDKRSEEVTLFSFTYSNLDEALCCMTQTNSKMHNLSPIATPSALKPNLALSFSEINSFPHSNTKNSKHTM